MKLQLQSPPPQLRALRILDASRMKQIPKRVRTWLKKKCGKDISRTSISQLNLAPSAMLDAPNWDQDSKTIQIRKMERKQQIFTLFAQLPLELQIEIWRIAARENINLNEVRECVHMGGPPKIFQDIFPSTGRYSSHIVCDRRVPAVFHVCSLSRSIALEQDMYKRVRAHRFPYEWAEDRRFYCETRDFVWVKTAWQSWAIPYRYQTLIPAEPFSVEIRRYLADYTPLPKLAISPSFLLKPKPNFIRVTIDRHYPPAQPKPSSLEILLSVAGLQELVIVVGDEEGDINEDHRSLLRELTGYLKAATEACKRWRRNHLDVDFIATYWTKWARGWWENPRDWKAPNVRLMCEFDFRYQFGVAVTRSLE